MKTDDILLLAIVFLIALFFNGESGYDLHTAIVTYLMGEN